MLSFHDNTENWTAENRCFHTDIYYVARMEVKLSKIIVTLLLYDPLKFKMLTFNHVLFFLDFIMFGTAVSVAHCSIITGS